MKKRTALSISILIIIILGIIMFSNSRRRVSMLLVNGTVHTVNQQQSLAEAIAVKDGRIIAVGSTKDIKSGYEASRVIDLEGRPVFPGFIDAHAHLEGLGAALMNLNVGGTSSIAEIQSLVAQRASAAADGEWIRGRGWDQNKWATKDFPTHEMLDEVSPKTPVYLNRVDGHAVWVNMRALELAGITSTSKDPEGGRIVRDKKGNPTGVFIDNAVNMLDGVLPDPSEVERTHAIERAVQECLKFGLTEVHDMGVDLEGISIYKKLIDTGKFPFRVYAAIDGPGETWKHYLSTGPEVDYGDGRLSVRTLKMYADGALGSRGAALIEPYDDDPPNRGLTRTSLEVLTSAAKEALDHGFQVSVHAIGDRGNHIVLNSYEVVFKSLGTKKKDVRFRVEHAQIVAQDDIPRFAKLNVIPSMQPTHCTSDMYWAEGRVGPVRIRGAYAWRSFINSGSIIPGGSDAPVESPNPLWGFYSAITRQDHVGWPDSGWYANQRLTREEALNAFTVWGAYAGFQETVKGSIEPGKYADLVVLSDDIMSIAPRRILDTKVHMTMVAGEVVYTDSSSAVTSHR